MDSPRINANKHEEEIRRDNGGLRQTTKDAKCRERGRVKYSSAYLACLVVKKNVGELREISKIPIHRESMVNRKLALSAVEWILNEGKILSKTFKDLC